MDAADESEQFVIAFTQGAAAITGLSTSDTLDFSALGSVSLVESFTANQTTGDQVFEAVFDVDTDTLQVDADESGTFEADSDIAIALTGVTDFTQDMIV